MKKSKKKAPPGFKSFTAPMREPRLVACSNVTVIYTLAAQDNPSKLLEHHLNPGNKDQQIRDLLTADPRAQFTPELQQALGITVIQVQRDPNSSSSALDDDVPIGYEE